MFMETEWDCPLVALLTKTSQNCSVIFDSITLALHYILNFVCINIWNVYFYSAKIQLIPGFFNLLFIKVWQYDLCVWQNRQLLKDSFMVELVEGARKLRHVFLFTDLLLCAKLKKPFGG